MHWQTVPGYNFCMLPKIVEGRTNYMIIFLFPSTQMRSENSLIIIVKYFVQSWWCCSVHRVELWTVYIFMLLQYQSFFIKTTVGKLNKNITQNTRNMEHGMEHWWGFDWMKNNYNRVIGFIHSNALRTHHNNYGTYLKRIRLEKRNFPNLVGTFPFSF